MEPRLSLEEAQATKRCRVCGDPVPIPGGQSAGWMREFGRMVWPVKVTLNFGDEFAHTDCLLLMPPHKGN